MINYIKKIMCIILVFTLFCVISIFSIPKILYASIIIVECADRSIFCEGAACEGADGLGCFCYEGGVMVSVRSCN